MPDSSGEKFKGIMVSRLYPGHRDYQPRMSEWDREPEAWENEYARELAEQMDGRPARGEPSKSS